MEYIREVKITVYVETNKAAYEKKFDNIEDAIKYLNGTKEAINGK